MIKWMGEQYQAKVTGELKNRLKRACIHLSNAIKKNLSTKAAKDENGRYVKWDSLGDFPHLRSGELRRSTTWEIDDSKLEGRVGTNKLVARYLEKGTKYMAEREFLDRTMEAEKGTIKDILAGKPIT